MALFFSKETGDDSWLSMFYKIINGLAQLYVPLEGILIEAYESTRRRHTMKFRQIGHTTILII